MDGSAFEKRTRVHFMPVTNQLIHCGHRIEAIVLLNSNHFVNHRTEHDVIRYDDGWTKNQRKIEFVNGKSVMLIQDEKKIIKICSDLNEIKNEKKRWLIFLCLWIKTMDGSRILFPWLKIVHFFKRCSKLIY